jgi:hypothetical protein
VNRFLQTITGIISCGLAHKPEHFGTAGLALARGYPEQSSAVRGMTALGPPNRSRCIAFDPLWPLSLGRRAAAQDPILPRGARSEEADYRRMAASDSPRAIVRAPCHTAASGRHRFPARGSNEPFDGWFILRHPSPWRSHSPRDGEAHDPA